MEAMKAGIPPAGCIPVVRHCNGLFSRLAGLLPRGRDPDPEKAYADTASAS